MIRTLLRYTVLTALLALVCLAEIRDGSKTVTTAGTAEALSSSSVKVVWVTIQAKLDNTGYIYVGASTVSSTRGIVLQAGDSFTFQTVERRYTYDLSKIYIDASVSGEGVVWVAEVRP